MSLQFGFDLGGTKTEIAVLDAAGDIVFRRRLPTPADSYPLVLKNIEQLLNTACTD